MRASPASGPRAGRQLAIPTARQQPWIPRCAASSNAAARIARAWRRAPACAAGSRNRLESRVGRAAKSCARPDGWDWVRSSQDAVASGPRASSVSLACEPARARRQPSTAAAIGSTGSGGGLTAEDGSAVRCGGGTGRPAAVAGTA